MKTFLSTILFLVSFSSTLMGQENEKISLTIDVTVKKYNKGTIFLALYNNADAYMKKVYRSDKVKVENGKAQFIFKNVDKGEYAFSLFHDVNGNKKMDKNFLGVPKEPYAFSNNLKGRFGPPSYEKAKFELNESSTVTVTIK